ncbi:MAG: OmpA family protein [Acidobacteriota bacterium]|jgi:outer membrane protein OmpA-like peptidoglycan-associated protein|nr:MAG: hypothetical protein DIU54_09090 [Acidobacteriota bacterium]
MRRLVGVSALALAFGLAPAAAFAQPAQPSQASSPAPADEVQETTRPATTTATGTTGIWFVPSGSVLDHGQWSVSLYRANFDDGQGFTDISYFPVTFAVGVGNRAEIFGSLRTITRIDRDTRPLFFEGINDKGTGGGIVPDHPLVNSEWTGNKIGDLWLGGKVNLTPDAPAAFALRGMVKLPMGDDGSGASSGKLDGQVDVIVSHANDAVELSGFGGILMRGSPDGYELTNGLRWGVGAAFPQRGLGGLRINAELFGERYFDDTITAPEGLTGSDGSIVPTRTQLRSPAVALLGLTWQAPNGFFVGAAGTWNLTMAGRSDAGPEFSDYPRDDKGFQVRIGWHPGARRQAIQPPPPPPPPPPAEPPANRPPTVKASCDPCEVEVGRTSTLTADGQDPDGDPLTYQWKTQAGTVANPTQRQTPWTAPNQPGQVPVTVTVDDGRGGTASDTVTINVVQPREYVFEDVHFEFDRYNIRPDALKILDEAVAAMQENTALRLTIEGHTCNIGTAEYNLALGERRAGAVRDYLVSRGISADRLQTVSFGEERPKHDNSREETRRLNRRAALTVRLQ